MRAIVLLGFLCSVLMAQGFSIIEARRSWLGGRFDEGATVIRRYTIEGPGLGAGAYLWLLELETERGRFGVAADVLKEVRRLSNGSEEAMIWRHSAMLVAMGHFAEARRMGLRDRRWDGKDAKRLKAEVPLRTLMGRMALIDGKPELALALFEEVQKHSKLSSSFGYEWFQAQTGKASAHLQMKQLELAAAAAKASVTAAEKQWGPLSIPLADALDMAGMVDMEKGNLDEAERLLDGARRQRQVIYNGAHPKLAESYLHLAALASHRNRHEEAVRLAETSLNTERAAGPGGPQGRGALLLLELAPIYLRAGKADDAESCLMSALPILQTELGNDAPRVSEARAHLVTIQK